MKTKLALVFSTIMVLAAFGQTPSKDYTTESKDKRETRMQWWKDARFGLFIHWGLYSIPAGEWKGSTNHAEWIRTTAQIPVKEYEKFVGQFNPVRFNAEEWVRMAKDAGMKYIVITSKHHDGFCLFDSKYTDFDVMSTPFGRDILKELASACHKEGIKICWYHSIMDWHHPDYLPRREWETDRPADGASFDRYIQYLKSELKELLTNYGEISVLWFDGEWESTWNPKYGKELYNYVRSLQPNIIINNRVGAGRSGMEGMTKEGEFAGDFGTPEQEIPATGIPGVDWETCMTMNNNWGYNKHDNHWKSPKDLLQKLSDIASKGGNFLLNIGPTSEGVFPEPSVERLRVIGQWMKVNGESIYGTSASPFSSLDWGRCTQKPIEGGTRLFLHVFDWPKNGILRVPGILNLPKTSHLLADTKKSPLNVVRHEDALDIQVPRTSPDSINTVVVLDVAGKPDINNPPKISAESQIFVDPLEVTLSTDRENVEIRYTLDGSIPSKTSALAKGRVRLLETTEISARCFRGVKPVSGVAKMTFQKVKPRSPVKLVNPDSGIHFSYFEGDWDKLPDFGKLRSTRSGITSAIDVSQSKEKEHFGFQFKGFVKVPKDGVYWFSTESDDGSRLFIGEFLVVDNDGLHGMVEKRGVVALAAGYHPLRVDFFQKGGGVGLRVGIEGAGVAQKLIADSLLFHPKFSSK